MATIHRRGLMIAALAAAAGAAVPVQAQQTFSSYVGPDFGLWSVPGNWNNMLVPDVPGDVALVPGPRIVNLNTAVTLDKYGVGGVLRVLNGQFLGVRTQTDNLGVTGIFGGGSTALESTGNPTYLRLVGAPGSWAIHGNSGNPSFISMSATSANIIDGSSSGIIFFNEEAIQGSGQVGANSLTINNSGTITALHTGQSLTIDPDAGGMTNSGLLQSLGGQLILLNGVFTNTGVGGLHIAGGTGGFVTVAASRIIGGSLTGSPNPGEVFQFINGSVLEGVRLAGQADVPNGHLLYLEDSLECTGGNLNLTSLGNPTYLRALNDVTLFGTNSLRLSNTTANTIDANTSGLTLTNNLSTGIFGSGQLGANSLNIVNNTWVYADGSAGLTIDPVGSTPFENFSHVIALSGSSLTIINGTFDNNGQWWIEVQPNATCTIAAAAILGGNLASAPGGSFTLINGSSLYGVNLTATTTCNTPNGHLAYLHDSLNNQGVYNLNSTGNPTYLRVFTPTLSLTGGGTIACTNTTANTIDAQSSGNIFTIQDQTLRGSCQLGANSLAVVNNGLVEAQGNQGIIIDSPGSIPFDNNTVVRALTGSSITITNSTFDNTGALVEVQDGASCLGSASLLSAGTWRSLGSGQFTVQSACTLSDITIDTSTAFNTPNGHINFWQAAMTNRGTYNLNSTGNPTYLRIVPAALTVTGGGTILCSNTTANTIDAQSSGNVLTIQDQTLRGSCQLGANSLAVVNNGLIEAQGSQGIVIDSPGVTPFDNNTVVRALTGSSLTITGTTFDNTGALVEVQDGASGVLAASTLREGIWRSIGSGQFTVQSSSGLDNITIDTGSTFNTPNGHINFLLNTLTNRGSYNLNSTGNPTYLRANAPAVNLTGGGTILCTNTAANIIDAQSSGNVLTLQDQTLRGSCQLGLNSLGIVNHGSIIADSSQGIQIDPQDAAGFTNGPTGLLHATLAGSVTIFAGNFSTAGTVVADPGRLIRRAAGSWVQTGGQVIANGEVQVDNDSYLLQGGTLMGSGLVDSTVTNSGGLASPGESAGMLTIEGAYTQQAGGALFIEVAGPGAAGVGFDRLVVTGAASLNGTISAHATNGYTPVIGEVFDVVIAASRTGTFSAVDSPEFSVSYTPTTVRLTYTGPRCDPDVNQDGNVDQDDVSYLINVVGGGDNPAGTDPDYNQDGNADQDDITALINTIAGGGCP
jgi:hypothetical protein